MIEFYRVIQADVNFATVCDACGSIVYDEDMHINFHAKVDSKS